MAVNTKRFNRIINLTINRVEGAPVVIKTPVRGRKPKIEINGTWTTDVDLPAFNITIQNYYPDMLRAQYSSVNLEVGYQDNLIPIHGTILNMYQESPGPEGRTVIQCQLGFLQQWLDTIVDLNYKAGTTLDSILDKIVKEIKGERKRLGTHAQTLSLKEPMQFNGTARDAITDLINRFKDDNLAITINGQELRAICLPKGDNEGDTIGEPRRLEYISAPPQENPGDEAGSYYTTINAPWMPELSIGDELEVPSKVYVRNFATVGNASKGTQNIQVTTLSFHFGTVGSVNSMTVQGFLVR